VSVLTTGYFTVKAARNRGTKPNPHGGTLVKWYVDFLDESGQPLTDAHGKPSDAYWQRKEGSEVNPGDKVYGEISEGDHGLRFKLQQAPDGGPSPASTGTSGSKEWGNTSYMKPQPPEAVARMGRAHAQDMAVQTCVAMGTFESKSPDQVYSRLKSWIDWFEEDVNNAGKAAVQGAGATASSPRGEVPGRDPAPEQSPADPQYLSKLLEDAGLDVVSSHALGLWIITKLDVDQQRRAEEGLKDSQKCATTLAELRRSYEATEGPLVETGAGGVPDDDIPFARPEYRQPFSERERWRF
jgi:hypothetical protein